MHINRHRFPSVVSFIMVMITGLSVAVPSYAAEQSDPLSLQYCYPILSVLFDPVSVSDALFHNGCSEKVALHNAISCLLCVRLENFLCNHTMQKQLSDKQRALIWRIKKRMAGFSYATKATPIDVGLNVVAKFTGFEDIIEIYNLLKLVDTGSHDRMLPSNALFQEFPFDELIARVPHDVVKAGLVEFKENGTSDSILRVINTGSLAERRSALACCAVMLVSMSCVVDGHIRGVASWINLIQIYEQVEQLPIENVLQAMQDLLYRVGLMLDSLNQKEEGFVGWLKSKWVYLPVTVIIIVMRIAKFYWGNQSMFNSYAGGNQWGGVSQLGSNSSFGLHNLLFEQRIEKSNSRLKNAEVVVGSA